MSKHFLRTSGDRAIIETIDGDEVRITYLDDYRGVPPKFEGAKLIPRQSDETENRIKELEDEIEEIKWKLRARRLP